MAKEKNSSSSENIPDFMKEVDADLQGFQQEIEVEKSEPEQLDITSPKKRGRPRKDRFKEPIEEKRVISDTIINGSLLLLLIDVAIPSVITLINNKVSKKKIKSNRLQLTAAQRTELEPIANEAAKYIQLQGNPVTMLGLALFGIYFTNLMLLKAD